MCLDPGGLDWLKNFSPSSEVFVSTASQSLLISELSYVGCSSSDEIGLRWFPSSGLNSPCTFARWQECQCYVASRSCVVCDHLSLIWKVWVFLSYLSYILFHIGIWQVASSVCKIELYYVGNEMSESTLWTVMFQFTIDFFWMGSVLVLNLQKHHLLKSSHHHPGIWNYGDQIVYLTYLHMSLQWTLIITSGVFTRN